MNKTNMLKKYMMFFDHGDRPGGPGTSGAPGQQQQPQQQQQQQQQTQQPVDPFEGVDLDMLDEQTKAAIEKARTELTNTRTIAQKNEELARSFQSRHDQTLQQLQRFQQQQVQQPVPQNQAPTLEQQIEAAYLEEGLNAEQAKAAAKLQVKIFEKFAPVVEKNIGSAIAPFLGHQAHSSAEQAFQAVIADDPLGAMQDPEISQRVRETIANLAGSGKIVDVEMVKNLRNVFAYNKMEAFARQTPQLQQQMHFPQQQQPQQQPPAQQLPFMQFLQPTQKFPSMGAPVQGAGGFQRVQPQRQGPPVADPEVAAAMAVVTKQWTNTIPGAAKILGGQQ